MPTRPERPRVAGPTHGDVRRILEARDEMRPPAELLERFAAEPGNHKVRSELREAEAAARLRWALNFILVPLGALTREQWIRLDIQTRNLSLEFGSLPLRVPTPRRRKLIEKCQQTLRRCLDRFERGEQFTLSLPARRVRPRREGHPDAQVGPRGVVREHRGGRLDPALLAEEVLRLLDVVGPERLRRCPFPGSPREPRCDRLFLAGHGRQLFCTPQHKGKAAYRRFWARRGGTRAKYR